MKQDYKILLVEDLATDAELIERELMSENIEFVSRCVQTEAQYISALEHFVPDIIISDQDMPQFDAFSAMKILKERQVVTPFLLVTGSLTDEEAVEYLKWGAFDYILKTNLTRLPFAVRNALSKGRMVQEKQSLEFAQIQMRKNQRASVERNKDITDSMIYAKGIQTALLPKQNYIHKYFPESFLLNMPKDIVNGDFYWFSEYEGKFIVAVGDCTGHGVPAALISMIGYNKLNYIVNKLGETDPAKILQQLNFEIQEMFLQEDTATSLRDGMDISICVIDKRNNLLEFAGANRPLFFIRNNAVEVIKGDKKCIGGLLKEPIQEFTHHTLAIDSISSIYLFTDGFLDQFGGEKDKKFLSKRFKSLLHFAHTYTMDEQKRILSNTLHDWKGDSEQTDDICVVGIRL